jgi:hypothetical protein
MAKKSSLTFEQRQLILRHIETDPNCTLKSLFATEDPRHLLPTTTKERRPLTQFRTKNICKRKSQRKVEQRLYVELCIKHQVPINKAKNDEHLRIIEEDIKSEIYIEHEDDIKSYNNNMATPDKSEEAYNKMLDARTKQQGASRQSGPIFSPKDTRKPTSHHKNAAKKDGTAVLCDKNQTIVEVDMIVHADTNNPWATVNGSLFSLIPNIRAGVKGSGKGVYVFSAFELLSLCPDPRDAELRECHLADDGYAWVMTFEVLPRSLMKDPESLTDMIAAFKDDHGKTVNRWVPRCQSTEDEYKSMFTRLGRDKIATAKVKIVTNEKCSLEHLNEANEDGKLEMLPQFQKRIIKLDGKKMTVQVLTLVWRAALVESIVVVEKPKTTVSDLAKELSNAWITAPEREESE